MLYFVGGVRESIAKSVSERGIKKRQIRPLQSLRTVVKMPLVCNNTTHFLLRFEANLGNFYFDACAKLLFCYVWILRIYFLLALCPFFFYWFVGLFL